MTDASLGAYPVGVAMFILGALGLQEPGMAHGALLAISGGLLLAAPTAGPGLLDWWAMKRGPPKLRTATIDLLVMVSATLVFAGAWLAQSPGYVHGEVRALGLILGLIAVGTLAIRGWLGGSIVFIYGHRVLRGSETVLPARDESSLTPSDRARLVERVRDVSRSEPRLGPQ